MESILHRTQVIVLHDTSIADGDTSPEIQYKYNLLGICFALHLHLRSALPFGLQEMSAACYNEESGSRAHIWMLLEFLVSKVVEEADF